MTKASDNLVERTKRILAFELRRPEMTSEPFSLDTMARNVLAELAADSARSEKLQTALLAAGEALKNLREDYCHLLCGDGPHDGHNRQCHKASTALINTHDGRDA
jgi:hypothetical protein